MKAAAGRYEVDDDPGRVDLDAAVAFLTTQAYWGRSRTGVEIKEQISGASRVTAAYDAEGAMVGFARAFGDGGTFYLADVYVELAHRGAGLGKALVTAMIEDGPFAAKRWMLHTRDAHGLYRRHGFAQPDRRYLERQADGGRADPLRPGPLAGAVVRLEPLGYRHLDGLVAASDGGGQLYRLSAVPQGPDQMRSYLEAALAMRDAGNAVPYAVRRLADNAIIGSTRLFDFSYWAWPRDPRLPDTCEIGHTWLSPGAIRTGANTEMKRLMLTHAFEAWQVQSVCLHTDTRNQRSRAAMERIGATFEGVLRAHRLAADGGPRDSARYSVTAADWPRVKRHLAELSGARQG